MFLKLARQMRGLGGSITLRLALMYGLTAFVVIGGINIYLYDALRTGLSAADQGRLETYVRSLQRMLLKLDRDELMEAQEKWQERVLENPDFRSRIMDGSQVLAATPEMPIPADRFPRPASSMTGFPAATFWTADDGTPYRLTSAYGELDARQRLPRLIQAAMDISDTERTIATYRWRALLMLVAGTAASTLLGYLIARRGLRPLDVITDHAGRVTAHHLSERIADYRWPIELRTLASRFDTMLERLERSFTKLSRFSADLAHELRGPINNLIGATDLALSRERTSEEYRDLLGSNLEELQRLAQMVDSMLFLAKAENRHIPLETRLLVASCEMRVVAALFEAYAADLGCPIRCEGNATLVADSMLVRRALSNLISNALKYGATAKGIEMNAWSSNGNAVISVRDHGPGVAPDHAKHLFDRFFRGESARSRDTAGTGLGLSIVRSIMELHHGSVEFHRVEGGGAEFRLVFPPLTTADQDRAYRAPPAASRTAAAPANPAPI